MSKVKPIAPNDMSLEKKISIPDEVIEAFNELIVENWKKDEATVKQKDAVARIVKKLPEFKRKRTELFELGYLDVEKVFRGAGWVVEYESPDRGDSGFDEYFTFRRKS